jgi:hypothetical protein
MTSPNLGAAYAPFGGLGAPYGFGTPAVAPFPGGSVNRSVATGRQLGSLALSIQVGVSAGQYIFDEFGRRTGMPDAQHMVILALRTIKGSSVDPELGQNFGEIRKITDSFQQDMQSRVEEALAALVAQKLIRLDAVVTNPARGMPASTRIFLSDLTTETALEFAI